MMIKDLLGKNSQNIIKPRNKLNQESTDVVNHWCLGDKSGKMTTFNHFYSPIDNASKSCMLTFPII